MGFLLVLSSTMHLELVKTVWLLGLGEILQMAGIYILHIGGWEKVDFKGIKKIIGIEKGFYHYDEKRKKILWATRCNVYLSVHCSAIKHFQVVNVHFHVLSPMGWV